MENLITIEEALKLPQQLFIDLRSPVEFKEAHIPGAINIPLLDDEERSLVGTIYKYNSPQEAVDEGFSLVAPKLPDICSRIKSLSQEHDVVLYCFRGGMRSQSICQVLSLLGTRHFRLQGGFKAFRQKTLEFIEEPFDKEIVVLYGLTGVGKTEILRALQQKGLPAIDLEGMANNRGSVFGHVGMQHGPSQKHFEGLLYKKCLDLAKYPRVAVECESRRIGKLILPSSFFDALQGGRRILIYDTMDHRIERLISMYTVENSLENVSELCASLERLKNRLGNAKIQKLNKLLLEKNYREVAHDLLVEYYDPLYHYPDQPSPEYERNLSGADLETSVMELEQILKI